MKSLMMDTPRDPLEQRVVAEVARVLGTAIELGHLTPHAVLDIGHNILTHTEEGTEGWHVAYNLTSSDGRIS